MQQKMRRRGRRVLRLTSGWLNPTLDSFIFFCNFSLLLPFSFHSSSLEFSFFLSWSGIWNGRERKRSELSRVCSEGSHLFGKVDGSQTREWMEWGRKNGEKEREKRRKKEKKEWREDGEWSEKGTNPRLKFLYPWLGGLILSFFLSHSLTMYTFSTQRRKGLFFFLSIFKSILVTIMVWWWWSWWERGRDKERKKEKEKKTFLSGQDMKILSSSNSFITHPVSFTSLFPFSSFSLSQREIHREWVKEKERESFSLSQFSSIFPSRMKELYSFPANVVNPREGDFPLLRGREEEKKREERNEGKIREKRGMREGCKWTHIVSQSSLLPPLVWLL